MTCPECHATEPRVLETRHTEEYTRRRRECVECGHRWTTAEIHIDTLKSLKWSGEKYYELRLMIEDLL